MRVVALPKPTDMERGQWYFQRYIPHLPNPGEIVFFDRSWYNRAVVEPVNGFCSAAEYRQFMFQVPSFENLLHQDGIILIKFWFDISKQEQKRRLDSRQTNPLKQWKQSPVDASAQDLWEAYTFYESEMLRQTHMPFSPWIIVRGDDKKKARLETIRYVLNEMQYPKKNKMTDKLRPDPGVVKRYYLDA
jgi:polyphosphate kinase 2